MLGVLFYNRGQNKSALEIFEKIRNKNQKSIMANYWMAQSYLSLGDRNKAIDALKYTLETAPRFFPALYALGELNMLMGRPEIAKTYYLRAKSVKKNAGVLLKIGLIYEKAKQYSQAEKAYQDFINGYPDLFFGYNQLAWMYASRGINLDKAMKLARKADKLQPGNAAILDTLGWIHYQKKELDKALESIEKVNRITPNSPVILYHLGAIHLAKGDHRKGKGYIEKALSISGDFEGADEARKAIGR